MSNRAEWDAVDLMPTLDVTDLEQGISYYQRLGFQLLWRYPEGQTATHAGMEFGRVRIILARAEEPTSIQRQNLYVIMKHVRGYHAELPHRLGDRVADLVQSDYGMLDFSLRDPWGHLLTFGEEC